MLERPARLLRSVAFALLWIGLLFLPVGVASLQAQSGSLPTDRARVTVASIPDAYNPAGPPLKVLRTDANTPLRAGTAWIWEKDRQEEPESYYASMRAKGLNAVRMILFDTWEIEAYAPSPTFTPTDWNDPAYRTRQLARMERAVNFASVHGMYVIINSHNKIPNYAAAYNDALWTHVAPYFAARTHVLYEAANEPMDGIGNNGSMTASASDRAADSPRIQALKQTYNIIRSGAPDTHIMILSPPGINDYATGTGLGNLAAAFAAMPGPVDWTKTSVAYHLYNNDSAFGAANNAANLRNLHSRFPGWPSENNFPASVSNATLGITDTWRSAQFDSDIFVNQTCERLGLGWSMWNINGQAQLDRNWPVLLADATAKGWTWTPDPYSPPPVVRVSSVRVNAAGPAVGDFAADSGFTTTSTQGIGAPVSTSGVTNAAPAALYDTERWHFSAFTYTSPVLTAGRTYTVRLHFAERYVTAASQRRFNISVNGAATGPLYIADFDVFAAAGNAMHRAVVRTFAAISPTTEGRISITLSPGSAQLPMINGLEILAEPTPWETWRNARFSSAQLADPTVSAPAADPDADGVVNLLEYALNSTPTDAGSASAPLTQLTNSRLQFSFIRARSELDYVVLGSNDLAAWSTVATNPGSVSLTNPVTVTDTVILDQQSAAQRFLRLRISLP